jgi:hypothetical protein
MSRAPGRAHLTLIFSASRVSFRTSETVARKRHAFCIGDAAPDQGGFQRIFACFDLSGFGFCMAELIDELADQEIVEDGNGSRLRNSLSHDLPLGSDWWRHSLPCSRFAERGIATAPFNEP